MATRAPAPEDVARPKRAGALSRLMPSRLTPWRVVRVLGLVVALVLLVLLIRHLGPRAIANELVRAGPGFIWILLLHGVAIALSGMPWHVMLPRDARPRVMQSIASRFVAAGANAVLPIVAFAGDFVRLWWLPRKSDRSTGVAAIIADRLTYGAANIVFVLAGSLALIRLKVLPPFYARAALIGVLVMIFVVSIGVLVASRYRIAGRIHRLIRRIRRKSADSQFGDDVDEAIEEMLRAPRPLAMAFLYNLAARLTITAEIYIAFALLGVDLSWEQLLVFTALPIVIAVAGALVPSQIGVQEGAQALIATSFGISPTTAVAVVLLMRIRSLVGGFVVWFLLARRSSAALRSVETMSHGNAG